MKRSTLSLALVALSALPALATAAPITWGTVQNISGDGDVSTNGTLVDAWNFGSAAATTVNGVLFQAVQIGAPQVVSVGFGAHTLSIDPERVEHTLTNFATGSALPGPFASLTGAYQALLDASAGSNFADRENNLLLGGLTFGRTYEFQAWFNDSGTVGEFGYGLTIGDMRDSFGDWLNAADLDPSTQVDSNGDYIEGGTGQWVIGTFIADAATKALIFERGEIGGGINGFQLRELTPTVPLPLPGTLALVGAALFAAGAVQRRQRRTA